jgi:hypothetical protein
VAGWRKRQSGHSKIRAQIFERHILVINYKIFRFRIYEGFFIGFHSCGPIFFTFKVEKNRLGDYWKKMWKIENRNHQQKKFNIPNKNR